MKCIKLIALSALALALFTPRESHAQAAFYSSVGAGCNVQQGGAAYTINSDGGVFFSGTATGSITLFCSIPFITSAGSIIELMYQDSSSVAGNVVTATYTKVNVNTGAVTILGTANSNLGPVSSGSPKIVTAGFSDVYDFNNFRYFVRVVMSRTSSANVVAFHALSVY